MDVKQFNDLQVKVSTLEKSIENINQKLSAFSIDAQLFIKKKNSIKPSISSKVAFDQNGLIVNSEDLVESDIPTLSIDKIKSLRRELNRKIDKSELNKILIDNINNLTPGEIVNTGIKINYDKNGLIVNSSNNLLENDIPDLSIDKIIDLKSNLDHIKSLLESRNNKENNKNNEVIDSNILLDNKNLRKRIKDIESRLSVRMDNLESNLDKYASKESVENVIKVIDSLPITSNIESSNDSKILDHNQFDFNQIDYDNIINRISNLEKSMQYIINQFDKISELIKLNDKIDKMWNYFISKNI